jgi:hypothetical protein
MTQYRRRPENVEAFHYEKALLNMDGSYPFPDWLQDYYPIVTKSEDGDTMSIHVDGFGYMWAESGDWIVKNGRGNIDIVPSWKFHLLYEAVK